MYVYTARVHALHGALGLTLLKFMIVCVCVSAPWLSKTVVLRTTTMIMNTALIVVPKLCLSLPSHEDAEVRCCACWLGAKSRGLNN